jgi:hypothetical protein
MKTLIIGVAIIAITASARNRGTNNSAANKKKDTTVADNATVKETGITANADGAMREMVTQYLQIKNALTNDNGKDAATAGNVFVASMGKMEETSLTTQKRKTWDDLSDDAKEMAEHIGKSADKIEHQREHFDMLSRDMYDMVKAFGAGRSLYNDYCPMYNNKKGATWLSETKEIKNIYFGKKMLTCGTVKEEMK